MTNRPASPNADVELLLKNAHLRDELEPFLDESVDVLTSTRLSLQEENEFLESILAWERAPSLPISKWFEPELVLPSPDTLSDEEVFSLLWRTIHQLYSQKIALDFTDHLSDRQLYCLGERHFARVVHPRSISRDCSLGVIIRENEQDVWLFRSKRTGSQPKACCSQP
jgi:hypothetical protein